jgi:TetR/AcrR family transcriptional repressor of nem operon
MKVSRKQAQSNREAIVGAASRLFRERGIAATGVAEVTRAAGLTHGGFYAQFPGGKEGLAAEAIQQAFDERRKIWEALAEEKGPAGAIGAIADSYLSDLHLDSPGDGCPIPSLATDASRMNGPVRTAFSKGVQSYLDVLARHEAGATEAERYAAAARTLAVMAGAMLLARAVDDRELAETLLQAAQLG